MKKVKLTLIEKKFANFFSSSIVTCGFYPYNPPHVPSHYSLTLPSLPFNYQFFLILYFSLPSNTFFPYFPFLPLLLILFHHGLIATTLSRDSFFLSASTLTTFLNSSHFDFWVGFENTKIIHTGQVAKQTPLLSIFC